MVEGSGLNLTEKPAHGRSGLQVLTGHSVFSSALSGLNSIDVIHGLDPANRVQ